MRLLSNSEVRSYRRRIRMETPCCLAILVLFTMAILLAILFKGSLAVLSASISGVLFILGSVLIPLEHNCLGLFGGFKHARLEDRIKSFINLNRVQGLDPRILILDNIETMGETHRQVVNNALLDNPEYFKHPKYGHMIRTSSGEEFSIQKLNTDFRQDDPESPIFFHNDNGSIEIAPLNTVVHALLAHRIYLCFQDELEKKIERDKITAKKEAIQNIKDIERKLAKIKESNNLKSS